MKELHRTNLHDSLFDIGGRLFYRVGPGGNREPVASIDELVRCAGAMKLNDKVLAELVEAYFSPEPPTVLSTVSNAGPGITSHVIAFCDDGSVWRKDTDVNDTAWEPLAPVPGSWAALAGRGKADPAQARHRMAADIERWVNQTYWPNDKSAEAVRELAHAIGRNDVADFVDGEDCARYDRDEGDRKAARWKRTDLLNLVDRACQEIRERSYTDADTADMMKDLLEKEIEEALGGE